MAAIRTSTTVASSLPAYAQTAGRAVHIKIHPRPLNIAESRHVLRTLQKYGEVAMYKHLKHEPEIRAPHTALAIFETKEAAAKALAASPLSFSIERPAGLAADLSARFPPVVREKEEYVDDDDGHELDEMPLSPAKQQQEPKGQISRASTEADSDPIDQQHNPPPSPRTSNATSNTGAPPNPQQSPNSNNNTKQFRLLISPSTQNHAAYLSRQHYHSRFKLDTRTIMGQDLESRVPHPAFADLQLGLGEVPLRLRNIRAEEEKAEGRGWWKKSLGEMRREGRKEDEEMLAAERERGGSVIQKYAYTVSALRDDDAADN